MSRLDKIKASSAFQKANEKALKLVENKDQLSELLADTASKLKTRGKEKHRDLWALINDALAMVKAYVAGEYKQLPKNSLLMIVAALIYFVMPFDFIPDFLLGLGLIDDIAILTWTLSAIRQDIEDYISWRDRTSHQESTDQDTEGS